MKIFNDNSAWDNDYTYSMDTIDIWTTRYIRITQTTTSLKGQRSKNFDIDANSLLNMSVYEYDNLRDCVGNQIPDVQGCVTDTYGIEDHKLGLYSNLVLPVFGLIANNTKIELVFDNNTSGQWCLRRIDISQNRITDRMYLSAGAAGFIMQVLLDAYDKNKGICQCVL